MAYSDKIVDHFNNPRHVGTLDKKSPNVGVGLAGAPACGDVLQMCIEFEEDENGKEIVKDAKFKAFGCGAMISCSSLATEWVMDGLEGEGRMNMEEVQDIKNTDLVESLDLNLIKIHCSVLTSSAIKLAIEDYKSKKALRDAEKQKAKRESEKQFKQEEQNA